LIEKSDHSSGRKRNFFCTIVVQMAFFDGLARAGRGGFSRIARVDSMRFPSFSLLAASERFCAWAETDGLKAQFPLSFPNECTARLS